MFEILGLGAEFTFDAQGTERISDIVGRLQSLSSQMNLSTQDTVAYSNTLTEFGDVIIDMGKQLMVAGGATTAAAMYGVSKAAEWQSQMVDAVRYMSDDSVEAQTAYNKTLKETAQLLGRTKEEINASAVSYMMMGKSTEDALRLTKNAGYAAVAWDMTADSVADSFRTIKAAFNVNLEDQDMYQKYLDTINKVGNSTAATSKDVVAFLADGGSALHNVANVSIEQAMGMASAARYANMSIAEFSTMMIRLGNQYAQDKSTEYFSKLGIEVKEADGSMRSFADVLYDVQKQWNNLDQATRSEFASGVGGVYADRLSLYMGSGEEYIKGANIAQQDNTGSAEAEFNRVTDTYEMAMARFKVTLSDFGTAFWGTLLPPLTKFINLINNVVTAFSNFAQAHPGVMKLVASVILLGGVLTTLAGVGLVVAGMFAKLRAIQVSGHFATLRTQILSQGLSVVFRNLGQTLGPVIFKFGKLAGVMGILYLSWKYDIFNIRSMMESFVSNLKMSFETSKKLMSNSLSLDDFKKQIQDLNNSNSVWDKMTLGITKVGLALKGLGQYAKQGFLDEDMFQRLNTMGLMPMISIILGLGMRFKALWKGFKEGFMDAITTVNNAIKSILGPAFNWLKEKILLPVMKAFFGVDESVTDLGEAIKQGIQFVDLDKMFGKIETWERVGKVIGVVAAAVLMLSAVSKGAGVISIVAGAIGHLGGVLGGLGGLLHMFGGGLLSGILGSLFGGGSGGGGGNGGNGGGGGGFHFKVPNPTTILKGLADIAIILGGFTIIVGAYGALSQIPGFNVFMEQGINTLGILFSRVGTMAVGIGALALLTGVVSMISPTTILKGLADIAIILGGFSVLFVAFGALSTIPEFSMFIASGASTLEQLFSAMNVFVSPSFIALTAITAIMGALSPATFLSGIVGLAVVLGGFTILISAFAALTMIPGFTDFITSGGETLSLLFGQLGNIVGSLVAGFAEGLTSTLPEIGTNLAGFAENVRPFFEVTSSVPLEGVSGFISALGQFMLMMAGESVLSFITGGPDLVKLGEDLSAFGESAGGFFEAVAGYPEDGVDKASKVFESISNLGGYATKSGGLAQLFTGSTELPQLGEDLSAFGESAVGFFESVATYSESGLEKAPRVFEAISSLGGYATKSGGLAQLFTGSTDLPGLGEDLTDFADAVVGFFTSVATFPQSSFDKGKQVFEVLNGIGDYDFKSGGLAQLFTGSTDLAGIGEQLTEFGGAIQGFFDIAGAFSFEAINKGKQIFIALQEIGDGAFRSGGFVEVFTGGVDIVGVGTQLSAFATSVQGFFTVAGSIEYGAINKAGKIFESLEGIGDFTAVSLTFSNLGNAGTQLTNFINNAEEFFTKAISIDLSGVERLQSTVPALKEFFGVFDSIGIGTISSLTSEVTNFTSSLSGLNAELDNTTSNTANEFNTMVASVNTSLATMKTDLDTQLANMATSAQTGTKLLIDNMVNGISVGTQNVSTAIRTLLNAVKVQIDSFRSTMYASGQNAAQGLADGIASKASAVASAASSLTKAAGNYIGFNSPAKMGEGRHIVEWGYNMVSGFTDGVISAEGLLSNTMANVITNPVSDVLGDVGINGSKNVTLSQSPMQDIQEQVARAENAVVEKNSIGTSVNIDKGAIENHFHIDGSNGVNQEELMEMIAMMLDENLMPLLMDKIRELKVALNE